MAPTSHVELLITHLADLSYVKCTPDGNGGTVCAKHELPLPVELASWSPLVHHCLFALAMLLLVVVYGGYVCRSHRRRKAAAAAIADAAAAAAEGADDEKTAAAATA